MTFSSLRPIARLGLLAVAALLTLSAPAWAQWKWKDQSGRVQYSDLPPPPSVTDKDILQRPAGSSRRGPVAPPSFVAASGAQGSAAAGSAPAGDPELEAKRRKAEQDEAAKRKAEEAKIAAARADNCQRAKAQLRSLDDGMRMARVNEKGEREILDDKARADEAQRTREIIASDCK